MKTNFCGKFIVDFGSDDEGDFIQHSSSFNASPHANITKRYYEIVDKAILEHMPIDILNDLASKIHSELLRRADEKN